MANKSKAEKTEKTQKKLEKLANDIWVQADREGRAEVAEGLYGDIGLKAVSLGLSRFRAIMLRDITTATEIKIEDLRVLGTLGHSLALIMNKRPRTGNQHYRKLGHINPKKLMKLQGD